MLKLKIYPLYYDYDLGQVVSNIAYIRWLEHARCVLLDTSPHNIQRLMENHISPILIETHIRYRKSIKIGMDVELRVWNGGVGKSGWKLNYNFVEIQTGDIIAEGVQRGCFINTETGKPIAAPQEVRNHFEKVLAPED